MADNWLEESQREALAILWAAYHQADVPAAKRIIYHALNHVRGFAYEIVPLTPAPDSQKG